MTVKKPRGVRSKVIVASDRDRRRDAHFAARTASDRLGEVGHRLDADEVDARRDQRAHLALEARVDLVGLGVAVGLQHPPAGPARAGDVGAAADRRGAPPRPPRG